MYECRYDERLKTRVEESTRLTCTQLGAVVCLFATGLKKAKAEDKKCHAKTMKSKKNWKNS